MSADQVIGDRLSFMQLDEETRRAIAGTKSIVMDALPEALDRFYNQVRATPDASRFFSSESHLQGAKSRQLAHWEAISSGRFDLDYARAVTRVGEVHARIGLEPKWYIGGYSLVLESLIMRLIEVRWPRSSLLGRKSATCEIVAREIAGLVKATMLDIDIAVSVYFEAAEAKRKETEAEVIGQERATVQDKLGHAVQCLSEGDLTAEIPDELPAEYGQLRLDFNSAAASLRTAIGQINGVAGGVRTGAEEMASASESLSQRTEQQAASLEQTAAALDQITATVRKTADGAHHAREVVTNAKADAERSGEVVAGAIQAMAEIDKSSKQISNIIGVIDEIAFQTNLLALNAGVEAARAGEAGRGFAVVASEVRALAQRSADAAKEIKGLIQASSAQVGTGVELVGQTGKALERISSHVSEINAIVAEIAASAREQATGLAEVNTAVNQMDQVTQQNAAMVEESTAASRSLAQDAEELGRLVSRFHVGQVATVTTLPKRGTVQNTRPTKGTRGINGKHRLASSGNTALKVEDQTEIQDWEEF